MAGFKDGEFFDLWIERQLVTAFEEECEIMRNFDGIIGSKTKCLRLENNNYARKRKREDHADPSFKFNGAKRDYQNTTDT